MSYFVSVSETHVQTTYNVLKVAKLFLCNIFFLVPGLKLIKNFKKNLNNEKLIL